MTRVVVTGAGGFIGQRLVARLLRDGRVAGGAEIARLTVTDIALPELPRDGRLHAVSGSLADPAIRTAICRDGVDILWHLAAIPGGAAEANPVLGLETNVLASIALLDVLTQAADVPPIVVYASTIAVFGVPLPDSVDDETLPLPTLSYGAQKLMMETHLADLSRRGSIDARCIRLPGIVAGPRMGGGLTSAFMSNVFHDIPARMPITLPVAADGMVWVMSVRLVVDNLLHAAGLTPEHLPARRVWTLPALRASMSDLVTAIAIQSGQPATLASYEPVPAVQAQFADYPSLHSRMAERLGFQAEHSAADLVHTALADLEHFPTE